MFMSPQFVLSTMLLILLKFHIKFLENNCQLFVFKLKNWPYPTRLKHTWNLRYKIKIRRYKKQKKKCHLNTLVHNCII